MNRCLQPNFNLARIGVRRLNLTAQTGFPFASPLRWPLMFRKLRVCSNEGLMCASRNPTALYLLCSAVFVNGLRCSRSRPTYFSVSSQWDVLFKSLHITGCPTSRVPPEHYIDSWRTWIGTTISNLGYPSKNCFVSSIGSPSVHMHIYIYVYNRIHIVSVHVYIYTCVYPHQIGQKWHAKQSNWAAP